MRILAATLALLQTAPTTTAAVTATVFAPSTVPLFGVIELALQVPPQVSRSFDDEGTKGPTGFSNPFLHDVAAEFTHEETGESKAPSGFYDGNGTFRVRYSPERQGAYTWHTKSASLAPLGGASGRVVVTEPTIAGQGCPRAAPGKLGFEYPDGTTFNPVGTTCYAWVHQPEGDELEEQTLAS